MNEKDISGGWLEYYKQLGAQDCYKAACADLVLGNTPNPTGRVLTVDVDKARKNLAQSERFAHVEFFHTPVLNHATRPDNRSHSSIFGLADFDESVEQLAATEIARAWCGNDEWRELKSRGVVG